ncbi:50S ribosomal protein L4 [Veillonella montpellierensis DNF00314]|uniref:Large ribosomal subunit protein uL4 n=1 Tax=Veillonella montpellierensis DNF00314 TaxID=1401067 RepID=A0A096BUJ0_9FIRM|nr:50S ribosomal protein L4 [Veillonella montpellierensis]KGF46397.1 50S ribosomal protein L4 [Veillonella montpellierensis DNF00314]
MPTVDLYNQSGVKTGTIELNDAVFGVEVNDAVMHLAVVRQLANERLGTHATKTRGMVRGGGRKPWKQKGTGRARSGSTRSPLWVGGGTVFGPSPRSYYKAMPRKARRLAVKSALSAKVNESELYILEELTLAAPKTKEVLNILNNFNVGDAKVLFITEGDVNVELSARNIQGVKATSNEGINIFDLLHYDKLFITKGAVAKIEEVLG